MTSFTLYNETERRLRDALFQAQTSEIAAWATISRIRRENLLRMMVMFFAGLLFGAALGRWWLML